MITNIWRWHFAILFILTLAPGQLFAVSPRSQVDSLRKVVEQGELDPLALGVAATQLGQAYRAFNTDSALYFADQAIEVFEELSTSKGKAEANFLKANILYSVSQIRESKPWIDKTETLALEVGNDTLLGKVFYVKGLILSRVDDFEQGTAYFLRSTELCKATGQRGVVGRCYINIGRNYGASGDKASAQVYYAKSVEILTELKDSLNLGIALYNLAVSGKALDSTADVTAELERSAEILLLKDNNEFAVYPLFSLGLDYVKAGQLDLARAKMEQVEEVANAGIREEPKIRALQGMAWVLAAEGDVAAARKNMEAALERTRALEEALLLMEVMADYSDLEEKMGGYKKALELEREIKKVSERKKDLEFKKYMEELTVIYETEQKEAENALLREKEDRLEARQRWGLAVGALVALFLILIIFFLTRSVRRRQTFSQTLKDKNLEIEEKNNVLKLQNKELQHANREKDALMGVVAHDLKAPLSKIEAMIIMLESVREDPEQYAKVKGMIAQIVGGGKKLIEELVLLSALEKEAGALELEEVAVLPLVKASVEGFDGAARSKQIAIHLDAQESPEEAPLHAAYFGRILDNLLSNAIKFSPPKTAITVFLEKQASLFTLRIQDQGPGIPAEELPRLFEKFTRLSPQPTAGESSTGLGLSIVKELVQKMNGEIAVESKMGQGTTFTLTFPKV